MASFHRYSRYQASSPPSSPMSTSTNQPPPSPSVRTGFSLKHEQLSTLTHENGYRPYGSFYSDSDSPSKDSPVSASDRHSPYSDNPELGADLHLQSTKENKSSRRVYFDYGITTSPQDSLSPTSKFEDTQNKDAVRHSFLRSYPRFITPTSFSFPWELPSPSTARTPTPYRAHNEKYFRAESSSFYHSQPFWLALYFCFNLGLTLYNKAVLIHFPYAYALTALHALCGSIGGFALFRLGFYVPAKLTDADNIALVAFSLLYTINIAVSNLSLELVTIPVSPIHGCLVSPPLKLGPHSLVPPGRPSSYPDIHCSPFNASVPYPE